MVRAKPQPQQEEAEYHLTAEQARTCALSLRKYHLHEDNADIARFLLLLRALTYMDDATDRETILFTVEREFAPFMPCVDKAVTEAITAQLHEVRKLKSV